MPKMRAAVVSILSGLPLSRPALPRRNKPITIALITIAAIIITLIIDVTITIAAIAENLTLL
jgi:hypothetical protein